ncbi:histidine phosphatase family protein [uncultured Mucilaginibacter sp.]|uniref:histidine phosphatase family protein n=1 Tax=uncultured Mucilaginibacter sp. TaxID=797541 RepID=UPI0025F16064|nr:histidine phosphatase family protein [uncultured Mucilaginibacter sp.]
MYKGLLILFLNLVVAVNCFSQETVVWLVRHAEKQTAETMTANPELTPQGLKRAEDLSATLNNRKITAIYSTAYKRTLATANPLAVKRKLEPMTYSVKNLEEIAKKVLANHKGQEVLIVGHSNTLLPVMKALGADTPFTELTDDDYDMLFKVTVPEKGTAKLSISYYGEPHHTTQIPPQFTGKP